MKPVRILISRSWWILAFAVILLAILLSATRLMLPLAEDYRDEVAVWVSDVLGQPVRIGTLGAGWHGMGPSIELRDITVMDVAGQRPVLQCDSARIDINVPASLRHLQFEPGLLTVRGVQLSMVRREDGAVAVAGLGDAAGNAADAPYEGGFKWWLQRQNRLAIKQSSLVWRDLNAGGRTLVFTGLNLELRNRGDRHRLDATVNLPPSLGRRLELAMDLRGDLFTKELWQGQVYVRGEALQLGGWWKEQPPLDLAAAEGSADFEVWSRWLNGPQEVDGRLHAQDLRVSRVIPARSEDGAETAAAVETEKVPVETLSGSFRWQRHHLGWNLDVKDFSVTHQGVATPPAQWRVEYRKNEKTGARDWRAGFSAVRAQDLAGLLLETKQLPADWRDWLVSVAPWGWLRDTYLEYRDAPPQAPRFIVRGAFDNLITRATSPLPGVEGLSGRVTADQTHGVVRLDTKLAAVDPANLFRAPLPVDTLAGDITWRRDDRALHIDAPVISVRNPDIKLTLGFSLDVPSQANASPYLDLTAHILEGSGERVSRYLPSKIMNPVTVAWLDKAIVNGRITGGEARLRGRLVDFPFDKGEGLFDIRFDVRDGILDYAPGWPRLEEIATEVHFRGRRLQMEAALAKSLNAEVLEAKVSIPDMAAHPAHLVVEGHARGPTADAMRYLTDSPLRARFGGYLANVAAGGSSQLRLSLDLPLADLPARVKGTLKISDGSLLFRDAAVDLTHINGDLHFSEQGLIAEGVHAALLGQPVILAAATERGQAGAVTTFSARGMLDAATLAMRFAPALAPYVAGTAPWRGDLRIPPKKEGWVELEVTSPLEGVAVKLPPPLGKAADVSRDLLVQVPLPLQPDKPVHLRYGEIADAQLILKRGKGVATVSRGEVRLGGGRAVLPAQGIVVTGKLAKFDDRQWTNILPLSMPGRTASPTVTRVDMSIDELRLAGRRLDKVRLKAERGEGAWEADIDSPLAQGHIHFPDAEAAPLVMDMDRLYLPRFKKGGGDEVPPDPRKLRPLDITARDFHYGALVLGELQLHATRSKVGLSFEKVHTHSPQREMNISGAWLVGDKDQRSTFLLDYDGEDAGATLSALGFADMLSGGTAHTELQLDWPGPPTAFALAKASGSLSFEIKDGRLLEVEPGAGRILGLLSFQALPRRLLLDFSDLFRKGFAFDSLSGSFTIENGNAQTDNLRMDGPSARIEARGRVGLAAEDYDQRVTVTPNVTGGLPVAGVLAGGVGAGAALFLMEKMLKPGIDKMTRAEYRVTGSWTDPTVERINVAAPKEPLKGQDDKP